MRVPLDWLREYCDPSLDARGVEERLTMTGTKVEAIHRHGVRAPERFLVGRVLTCERHPNADRLSVCTVDLGPAHAADSAASEGPATIVCGAPNVAAGQTVAVACPGAVMPDGTEIKRAKLRGVASEGMILAEQELAIDSHAPAGAGILVLDESSQTGRPGGGQRAGAVPPAGGVESPAEGVGSRAEGVGSPAGGVESPAEGVGSPAGGVESRAEGVGSPAEGAKSATLESPSVESPTVGSSTAGPSTGTASPAGVPAPGTALAQVLPIATEVLELEITPNRPDCLGVYGVARELHAATGAPLAPAPWGEDPGSAGPLPAAPGGAAPAEVEVRCPDLCPRFTARVFEHVRIAPSPPWLKARLSAAGQRPINNVVDITNYVMLLTGQPLHAFDLDRVAGGRLVVRRAQEGEQVQTLDGQTRTLDGEMVVIEDGEGPTSIAGVMGGARSEVGEATTRVLMEVANWEGANIHRTSWALGLRSEASGRFEKGLAPEQCAHAQALAARLMLELCGATLMPGTIDVGREPAAPPTIRLREARVQAILGVPVARAHQQEILRALDFQTREAPDGLDVTVPALRRADVKREADLIEEVARIDGLEKLPATLPPRRPAGMLAAAQRLRRRAVDTLVGRGLYETVGWTFTSRASMERLRLDGQDPRWAGAVALENPLSEEHALLRTTLLGSLLDSAARNAARESLDLRIFEVGTVFQGPAAPPAVQDGAGVDGTPQPPSGAGATAGQIAGQTAGGTAGKTVGATAGQTAGGTASAAHAASTDPRRDTGIEEHRALGVLLSGRVAPPTWREPDPPRADLYAVKGALEALAAALRVPVECAPAGERHPFLHPGRAAEVLVDGESIGWLGELHPLVADRELEGAAVMEVDLDRLIAAASARRSPSGADARGYSDLISFPALRQDLAVVLPREVPAAVALAVVRETAGGLLADARVFDVYEGPQVGAGMRSLALALSFRAGDRTLSDEDVAPLRERIVAALSERLGGELRG